jgi:di/tricarboxylate transporter
MDEYRVKLIVFVLVMLPVALLCVWSLYKKWTTKEIEDGVEDSYENLELYLTIGKAFIVLFFLVGVIALARDVFFPE